MACVRSAVDIFRELDEWVKTKVSALSADSLRSFVVGHRTKILQWWALSLLGSEVLADSSASASITWLLARPEILALFVGSGDATSFGEALRILYHIVSKEGESEIDKNCLKRRLAVAVALTFSSPIRAYADESVIDPLARYREFACWYSDKKQASQLTTWHMRYVVGSWARNDELAWARENLPADIKMSSLSDVTRMVPYKEVNDKGVSIQKGKEFYDFQPQTLSLLCELGGVCGAVSKFTASFCQAFGIPAMPVAQPGHCAFLWRNPEKGWQLGNSNSGIGETFCHEGVQMAWGKNAWLMLMMEKAQQDFEHYIESEVLRRVGGCLCRGAIRSEVLAIARTICPYNFSAWTDCLEEIKHQPDRLEGWAQTAWTQLCAERLHEVKNVALGKTVSVSDCSERARNLIDGTDSEWFTKQSTAWIEIDLEELCTIEQVRIKWWGVSVAGKYTISSTDSTAAKARMTVQRKRDDAKVHAEGYNGWSELDGWTGKTRRVRLEMRDGVLDHWGMNMLFGIRQIVLTGKPAEVPRDTRAVLKLVAERDLKMCPVAAQQVCARIKEVCA